MLNIFYGRESIDKEKFIYDKISERSGRTLVIVPDQYTLEAEKQAFRLLGVQGLMDVEIVSMSRLGYKLLSELGGKNKTFIDKYGRHMLLSSIVAEHESSLQVFKGGTARKASFIELTNNFISEMKQYNIDAETLAGIRRTLPRQNLLSRKLTDLELIFRAYEDKIAGKYTDSEDYINLYTDKISQSDFIKNSVIWVYGFDSFAPKAIQVLERLMAAAEEVNVFLTYDKNCRDEELFDLTGIVMKNLIFAAEEAGKECDQETDYIGTEEVFIKSGNKSRKITHTIQRVDDEYKRRNLAKGVEVLESELFAISKHQESNFSGVTLLEAANMYNEAESAASFILWLLREKGFRYRDIVVICNDQEVRGSVIRRVFQEYGIDVFYDKKRSILSSPIAVYVAALLEAVAHRYRTSDIFRALKTGFSDLEEEEIEILENYAIKYRIKYTMWQKPFVKGQMEYGADGLEEINLLREKAVRPIEKIEEIIRSIEDAERTDSADSPGSVSNFVEKYYDFLIEDCAMADKITALITQQEEQGLLDAAEETAQIWGMIVNLLDQIEALTGENHLEIKEFIQLLTAGLSQTEVGVLPPTADDILMGTMQRTRSGNVKAIVVMGANEGLIPASGDEEGLFSMDEIDYLAAQGEEICKADKVRAMEEKLAIYRNLTKPSEYLWISYSAADNEGKETRPSEIVDNIGRIFPDLKIRKDIINSGNPIEMIGGRVNTLRHMTDALRHGIQSGMIPEIWEAVGQWFEENDKSVYDRMKRRLEFSNKQEKLPAELAEELYQRNGRQVLSLSPSRLERFSRCPFSHFVAYGLKPEERRVFEASSREIGDIYHRCLMEISEKISRENRWNDVTEQECRDIAAEAVRKEASEYRESVFSFSNEEKYKIRRIEDACFFVCWALIEQVRSGKILESKYEVAFGEGKDIPPIDISCGNRKVYIEGKIDRMDTLDDQRVKIIDYKTGREYFDITEARGGYRLQLMLYLKAAQNDVKNPAGVFYFLIDDPRVDLTGVAAEKISKKISSEMQKSFKLNGIMIDDDRVIEGIAGEFSGYSDIVPLRKSSDGTARGTSAGVLLTEDEFRQLQSDIDAKIVELCSRLAEGEIKIAPKKTPKQTPCTYCEYKGICRFDPGFSGCSYDVIK